LLETVRQHATCFILGSSQDQSSYMMFMGLHQVDQWLRSTACCSASGQTSADACSFLHIVRTS
jgi:hypothetical protein